MVVGPRCTLRHLAGARARRDAHRLVSVYLIGLTGGIASGKSTVARRLVEHGAVHIDADQLARQAVEPGTPALERIRREFGEAVIRTDGSLDREKLGSIVFNDDAARAMLNSIVHPAVHELRRSMVEQIERERPNAVVVYDVPLLVEAAAEFPFDLIVVTHAPRKTRVKRLVDERGLDLEHAHARVDAQASDEERLAIADVVIDTDGTLSSTMSQADALWHRIKEELSSRD